MQLPGSLLQYSQWSAAGLALCALALIVAFVLKWQIRFRLVGATGFMVVLTAGLYVLSWIPLTQSVIPGAIPYTLVYDNAGADAVIVVPADITKPQLDATLRQAASNLFTPGRSGRETDQLTIRARAIIHPRVGTAELVFVGQIERSLLKRDDPDMTITLFDDQLARLSPTATPSSLTAPQARLLQY